MAGFFAGDAYLCAVRRNTAIMKVESLLWLPVFLLGAFFSYGQNTSSVGGTVHDHVTGKGVEGAVVLLTQKADTLKTVSGSNGEFRFNQVATGRYLAIVQSLVYESDVQEALVISGKETRIEFEVNEKITQLEGLTVEARPIANSDAGAISLPIEKVMRMPANFFDPVRMLSSYPGVVTANDQANNIAVKGNSPTGLLWRLNGMDIVNPNHLANAGTFNDKPTANGGGVNILSAQMLDRTDFYSGNMPTRFGNVTSAALDMTLRNGNHEKREFTAQASLIGLDFAAETPVGKRSSLLVNARYSTVGLLSQLGVNFSDEKIDFQDVSFNYNLQVGKQGGSWSIFGFGGTSKNIFNAKPDSVDWLVDKDRFTITYHNKTGAIGTRLDLPLNSSFTLSAGSTFSSNTQDRNSQSIATKRLPYQRSVYESDKSILSSFASITGKFSSRLSTEFGVMVNAYHDKIYNYELLPAISGEAYGNVNSVMTQPYGQVSFRSGRFSATAGGRYMYSTMAGSAFDPRLNLQYQVTPSFNLYVTGGQASQMLAPGLYLGAQNSVSLRRRFLQKQFVEVGQNLQMENWKLNTALYYHYYDHVPVSTVGSFSALNYVEGVVTQALGTVGTGTNVGLTAQAERSFVSGYYLLAGGSVYKSTYTDTDGVERPTKFAGKYSVMVTGGREWTKVVRENNRSFGVHARMLYMGGLRETPIDGGASQTLGMTVFQGDAVNSVTLRDYVRFDLRLSWRRDKKNYTRTVALDIQNVAGIKNQAFHYYDAFQQKVVMQYQVGFIPVLVYRIDF